MHPSSCAGYVVVCAMLVDGRGMYIYCEDRKNYVSCAGYAVVCAILVHVLWSQFLIDQGINVIVKKEGNVTAVQGMLAVPCYCSYALESMPHRYVVST